MLVIVVVFFCSSALSQTVNLSIKDGDIVGSISVTALNNVTYQAFKGIPYARPPIGKYRFTAPVKNEPWDGTLDATNDRSECLQSRDDDGAFGSEVYGDEDCLYINVYRPLMETSDSSLPVLVWIHGGAFVGGNSSFNSFSPEFFLEQGLIFVSFNYRLGVFGFLSTEDDICPGNWGIKDQIMALKWVQNNIGYFGGNAKNVTIFGESAGGASVSLLMQTNQTTGLFHRAIMNSGTTLNLWSLNTRGRSVAQAIGLSLGIFTFSMRDLVEGLRNIESHTLQKSSNTAANGVFLANGLRGLPFAPTMEPDNVPGAVYINASDDLLRSGNFQRVPVMIGFNSNEAAAVTGLARILRLYALRYDLITVYLSPYSLSSNLAVRSLVGSVVKTHYFGLLPIATNIAKLTEFIGDDQFNRPIRRAADVMSNFVDVYFYVFGYESGRETYQGVGHAEDLRYLFSNNNLSGNDTNVSKNMVRLWSSFAKYGHPTPDSSSGVTWTPVDATKTDIDYLAINETLSMQTNPRQEMWDFYKDLFEIYGDNSYTTY